MKKELPDGWEWKKLGDIIELKYGKGLKKENRQSFGNVSVYGSNGIVGYHDEAFVNETCLIVGRKGSIGAIHISNESCWPIDTTYYIVPPKELDVLFLFYLLSTLNLDRLNKSTAIPRSSNLFCAVLIMMIFITSIEANPPPITAAPSGISNKGPSYPGSWQWLNHFIN